MYLTPETVKKLFPHTPIRNIAEHLPAVLNALEMQDLGDPEMTLMALATIRAESEGFVPISERVSKYNTSPNGHPFDKYDERVDLGNIGMYSGRTYKGRGFIQLTGLGGYRSVGEAIGVDLENEPELANDPEIAADILAYFLKSKETRIHHALENDNLRLARRLVNGGSHGLDRFVDCYERGRFLLEEPEYEDPYVDYGPMHEPSAPTATRPSMLSRVKDKVKTWLG